MRKDISMHLLSALGQILYMAHLPSLSWCRKLCDEARMSRKRAAFDKYRHLQHILKLFDLFTAPLMMPEIKQSSTSFLDSLAAVRDMTMDIFF